MKPLTILGHRTLSTVDLDRANIVMQEDQDRHHTIRPRSNTIGDRSVNVGTFDVDPGTTCSLCLFLFHGVALLSDLEGSDLGIEAQADSARCIGIDSSDASGTLSRWLELGLGLLLRAGEEQTDSCERH